MSIKIFVMTHKQFEAPTDSMYVPLQVGHAISPELGYLADDTGDNISRKNKSFCELTGIYWLWKNYHTCDYIGICHYRRYLINRQGLIFTEKELMRLLQNHDMITPKLLTLNTSYFNGFSQNHHQKDLLITEQVISEKYPDYVPVFHHMVHDVHILGIFSLLQKNDLMPTVNGCLTFSLKWSAGSISAAMIITVSGCLDSCRSFY